MGAWSVVRQPIWFLGGLMTTAVALVSPLHSAADSSLPVHMVQHVLLLAVAAPLLVAGSPLPTLLWCLPQPSRSKAIGIWRRAVRPPARPRPLALAGGRHRGPHRGAHRLAPPGALRRRRRQRRRPRLGTPLLPGHGLRVLVGGGAGTGDGARRGHPGPSSPPRWPEPPSASPCCSPPGPWYPAYPSLGQQQMGAVIMWAFPGVGYAIAAAALFVTWVAHSDRRELVITGRTT